MELLMDLNAIDLTLESILSFVIFSPSLGSKGIPSLLNLLLVMAWIDQVCSLSNITCQSKIHTDIRSALQERALTACKEIPNEFETATHKILAQAKRNKT